MLQAKPAALWAGLQVCGRGSSSAWWQAVTHRSNNKMPESKSDLLYNSHRTLWGHRGEVTCTREKKRKISVPLCAGCLGG